jgi:hypothetical protein
LYELTGAWADLQEAAENGEDVSDALAAIGDAIEVKAERSMAVVRNLESDIEAIAAEEQRLAKRRKTAEANVQKLRDYVRDCMDAATIPSIKRPTVTLSVGDGPEGVEVDDIDAVPPEFKVTTTACRVDKAGVKAAYKQHGECVSGTRIVRKRVLTVR